MPKSEVRRHVKLRTQVTSAVEDYLKAIFAFEDAGEKATPLAVAEHMKVSPPSATGMIQKIGGLGLLKQKKYGAVTLTPTGRKVALEVVRHHRLIELYLHKALGYSWDEVHEEAERLEHVISEDFEDRIAQALGNPTHDPHGSPIPTKNGALKRARLASLADAKAGQTVTIARVPETDPEILRYLSRFGLVPGATLRVLEVQPFKGPVHVKVEGRRGEHIGYELAGAVLVTGSREGKKGSGRKAKADPSLRSG